MTDIGDDVIDELDLSDDDVVDVASTFEPPGRGDCCAPWWWSVARWPSGRSERPKPSLADMVKEDWRKFMAPGQIAAEWRDKRTKVHAILASTEVFLDAEALQTREYLRKALALGLSALGYEDLDVAVVRGQDRRVTRLIARWAYQQVDDQGQPLYAGVRYLSRLSSDWECWALFDDTLIASQRYESIDATDLDLIAVATAFGLHVH